MKINYTMLGQTKNWSKELFVHSKLEVQGGSPCPVKSQSWILLNPLLPLLSLEATQRQHTQSLLFYESEHVWTTKLYLSVRASGLRTRNQPLLPNFINQLVHREKQISSCNKVGRHRIARPIRVHHSVFGMLNLLEASHWMQPAATQVLLQPNIRMVLKASAVSFFGLVYCFNMF